VALGICLSAGLLAGCGDGGDAQSTTKTSVTQVGASPAAGGSDASDAGSGGTTTDTAPSAEVSVEATTAIDVDEPIMLIPRPGDPGDLYLAERAGLVRRLRVTDGGRKLVREGETLLDISDDTTTEAERGLLGLAFSTDGDTLFVSHTNKDGNTRVASYAMQGDKVDAASRKVLIAQDQPFANHNGGNIAIGPDGKLWLGLGDGGAGDDPANRAQNPKTILGKMVRIDPNGGTPEIMVSGVRNPWRWFFDTDGSLWIADVGQNAYEEIDHLPAGSIKGANLGWSGYEGTHKYLDGDGRRPAETIAPIFDYSHEGGNCSITGGFVYRGKAIPALGGAYLFADYCVGELRAVTLGPDGKLGREIDLGVHLDSPVSFAADQAGEPYVLTGGGAIARLVPAS